MPRVRKGAARARKHKKILKSTRGYIGAASRRYRVAIEAWMRRPVRHRGAETQEARLSPVVGHADLGGLSAAGGDLQPLHARPE